jgi:hypothetical protein
MPSYLRDRKKQEASGVAERSGAHSPGKTRGDEQRGEGV